MLSLRKLCCVNWEDGAAGKALAPQPWQHGPTSQNPLKGGRRALTLEQWPLTYTRAHTHSAHNAHLYVLKRKCTQTHHYIFKLCCVREIKGEREGANNLSITKIKIIIIFLKFFNILQCHFLIMSVFMHKANIHMTHLILNLGVSFIK